MMNQSNPYAQLIAQQQQAAASQPPPQQPVPVQARPMQFQYQPSQPTDAKSGQSGAAMGGALGGMMSSDERSKREIQALEAKNSALTKALSSRAEYPDTSAPSSGMQALGQQAPAPSRANFADTPAANKLAAQNVGITAAQQMAPQAAPAPQPGQSDIRNLWAVNRSTPDLSALDEAYRRIGATQGS